MTTASTGSAAVTSARMVSRNSSYTSRLILFDGLQKVVSPSISANPLSAARRRSTGKQAESSVALSGWVPAG